jgi:hypothetical protein
VTVDAPTRPTIHLNGTGAEALLLGYEAAGGALRAAMDALEEAGPNARDYYPQGSDAFPRAAREHASRVERLRSVLAEIGDLHEHVASAPQRPRP